MRAAPQEFVTMEKNYNEGEEWEIDPTKLVIKVEDASRGAFGTFHRANYDGRDAAVKLLDWGEEGNRSETEIASLRAAFTQEVAAWCKLDHPNVAKFIGAIIGNSNLNIETENGLMGIPSNVCCVVIDNFPDDDLKSYLTKNRKTRLPFEVIIQLALDLARGLHYLHSKKIVHKHVKTDNMLLNKNLTLKLAHDFGVADRVETSSPEDIIYMAPELLNGNPYDSKCDVYSYGICLWEIYCCQRPYSDLSFSEVISAVSRMGVGGMRPGIPKCCPSSLANVMKRCWDAYPNRRPEMDEVVAMLEAVDTSKSMAVDDPQPRPSKPKGCLCFLRHRRP
ncbi:hypothetical protein Scep_017765 [Stephania cephalantha]|uniref:Protein kinase domain-containing protein n=1 Tax=Stephania cephalantha TaxID=152367 RepID=A0AAP0IS15_9MAGN